MRLFRYTTVDALGSEVTDQIEASDRDAARKILVERGLSVREDQLAAVEEHVSDRVKISTSDAAELGSQLAELTKSSLPLGPGLRAAAEEIPRRRLARLFRKIADRVDAGASLEEALESVGTGFPSHFRGLVRAGLKTGRLAEMLGQFVAMEAGRRNIRHQLWSVMAYPVVLTGIGFLLLLFFRYHVIPPMELIYNDFEAELPLCTTLTLQCYSLAVPVMGYFFGLIVLWLAVALLLPSPTWPRQLLYRIPVLGPLWRALGLIEFSHLMGTLLGQDVPMPKAFDWTADGVRSPDLADACRGASKQIEAGKTVQQTLTDYWQFPASLRPLVHWGEQTDSLPEAFRAAAEMYEGRVRVKSALLGAVVPPLVFSIIVTVVGFTVWALYLPMMHLISSLT